MAAGSQSQLSILDLVASTAAAIVMSRTRSEWAGSTMTHNQTAKLYFSLPEHFKRTVPLSSFAHGYTLTVKIYCSPPGASRPLPISGSSSSHLVDPNRDRILIETWRIRWEERKSTDRIDRSVNEISAFIRAVYSMVRMLPAYREFRRSDRLSYEFDNFRGDDKLWMNTDSRIMRNAAFAVVNHPAGRLEASVAYFKTIPERPEEAPVRRHAPSSDSIGAAPGGNSLLDIAMRTPLAVVASSPPAASIPRHVPIRHPADPVVYHPSISPVQPAPSPGTTHLSVDALPLSQHYRPQLVSPEARSQTPPFTRRDIHQYEAAAGSPVVHPGQFPQPVSPLPYQHPHHLPATSPGHVPTPVPLHLVNPVQFDQQVSPITSHFPPSFGTTHQMPPITDYHHQGSPTTRPIQITPTPITDYHHLGSPTTRPIQITPTTITDYHHQGSPTTRPVVTRTDFHQGSPTRPGQVMPTLPTDHHHLQQQSGPFQVQRTSSTDFHQGSPNSRPIQMSPLQRTPSSDYQHQGSPNPRPSSHIPDYHSSQAAPVPDLPAWKLDPELLHPKGLSEIRSSHSFAPRPFTNQQLPDASPLFRPPSHANWPHPHPIFMFTHPTRMSLSSLPVVQQTPSEALEHPAFFRHSQFVQEEDDEEREEANHLSDVSYFLDQCRHERVSFQPELIASIEDLAEQLANFKYLDS